MKWPARSPDMTLLDFWLQGVVKEKVNGRQPGSVTEVRQLMAEEIAAIGPEIIRRVIQSLCGHLGAPARKRPQTIDQQTFFMLRVIFCVA